MPRVRRLKKTLKLVYVLKVVHILTKSNFLKMLKSEKFNKTREIFACINAHGKFNESQQIKTS